MIKVFYLYSSMKKLLVVFLLCCYLIPCFGVSVSVHYCGGKVASISILPNSPPKCACGKRMMKRGCCKDKTVQFKATGEQTIAKQAPTLTPKNSSSVPQYFIVKTAFFYKGVIAVNVPFAHPPPLHRGIPVFLSNRVLLI